jgi:hypothetical protein
MFVFCGKNNSIKIRQTLAVREKNLKEKSSNFSQRPFFMLARVL